MFIPFANFGIGQTRFLIQHGVDDFVELIDVSGKGFAGFHMFCL